VRAAQSARRRPRLGGVGCGEVQDGRAGGCGGRGWRGRGRAIVYGVECRIELEEGLFAEVDSNVPAPSAAPLTAARCRGGALGCSCIAATSERGPRDPRRLEEGSLTGTCPEPRIPGGAPPAPAAAAAPGACERTVLVKMPKPPCKERGFSCATRGASGIRGNGQPHVGWAGELHSRVVELIAVVPWGDLLRLRLWPTCNPHGSNLPALPPLACRILPRSTHSAGRSA
jgi:hypothetical protein